MSGISKDLLIFDAAAPAESDNVGAYLRSADGTLLTHTTIGLKEALDVNVANSIAVDVDLDFATDSVDVSGSQVGITGDVNVTQGTTPWVVSATDLDIRDLAFATDKVDVSGSSVTVSATDLDIRDLAFATDKVDVTGSDVTATVTATDLDIRDLAFATDKVDVSGSNINAVVTATDLDIRNLTFAQDKVDASGSAVSVTGTVTVAATDLDIRDLSSATDSVQALGNVADDAADAGNPVKIGSRALSGALTAVSANNDRADLISDLYRRIWINSSANIGSLASQVNVTDVATPLPASPLAGRRRMLIQNSASAQIFIGHSGVTTANGTRIAAGANVELEVGDDVVIYAISSTASAKDIRVLEFA